jgi:hypothetical protein
MKYLSIYEEFAKKAYAKRDGTVTPRLDIKDYDWEYFFIELMEEYDMKVTTVRYHLFTGSLAKSFEFFVYNSRRMYKIKNGSTYRTKNATEEERNKKIAEFGVLAEPLEKLAERVEILGGAIYICEDRNYYLKIYITANTFESFKTKN